MNIKKIVITITVLGSQMLFATSENHKNSDEVFYEQIVKNAPCLADTSAIMTGLELIIKH